MLHLNSNPLTSPPTNRREFFRSAARLPLLVALVAASGVLIKRRGESGAVCTRSLVCRECESLAACDLPQAAFFKSSTKP